MTSRSENSFQWARTVTCTWLMVCAVMASTDRPNIVVIMADDMGFDDVSFRGSNAFLTPNIDALAFSGVILNRHYVQPMCTPSRAAFLTGRHPIHTGMQHYVIPNYEPWGLPLSETTIADVFRGAGYNTSLIGKWHMGFAREAYTPLYRGFDHHFGYLGAYVDYYDQTLLAKSFARGHDFRNDLNVTREKQGQYMTDILTEEAVQLISRHNTSKPLFLVINHLAPHTGNEDRPLQAPEDEIAKFNYMSNHNRSIYAAMVSKLDESVGQVVEALNSKQILNNSILLFYSDNGAPTVGLHANNGSNYPLRGQKNSPWDGALRSVAAIWSPRFQKHGLVWNQTIQVTDWLPTLASAAGIPLSDDLKLDGVNMWTNLTAGTDPIPRKILHNIDDIFNYVSYLHNEWKFVNGTTPEGYYDDWLFQRESTPDPKSHNYVRAVTSSLTWKNLARHTPTKFGRQLIIKLRRAAGVKCAYSEQVTPCNPLLEACLFNIEEDPCEQNNLFPQMRTSSVVELIKTELKELEKGAVPPRNLPADEKCDPKFYDYEWTWWQDLQEGGSSLKVEGLNGDVKTV